MNQNNDDKSDGEEFSMPETETDLLASNSALKNSFLRME